MKSKPYLLPLMYLTVVLAALYFNSGFVSVTDPTVLPDWPTDTGPIEDGYRAAPQFLGGFKWWYGPWIHAVNQVSFRPVASHFLWADVWLGQTFGWYWTSWTTFGLYAIACLTFCRLGWRYTQSAVCGLIAGLAAAAPPVFVLQQRSALFSWYPISDFLLCAALMAASLVYLDRWAEEGRLRPLWGGWVCFLAALLTKEYALVVPVIFLSQAWLTYRSRTFAVTRRAMVFQAGYLAAACCLFLFYRRLVVPHAPVPGLPLFELVQQSIKRNGLRMSLLSGNYAPILVSFSLLAASLILHERWRHHRLVGVTIAVVLLLWLLSAVSGLPELFLLLEDPFRYVDNVIAILSPVIILAACLNRRFSAFPGLVFVILMQVPVAYAIVDGHWQYNVVCIMSRSILWAMIARAGWEYARHQWSHQDVLKPAVFNPEAGT